MTTSNEHPDVPPGYGHLSMIDLLRLYTGRDAQPCPPELADWLDAAIKWREVCAAERRVRELEEELT